MSTPTIPTVDLSPFFNTGDESGQENVKLTIAKACTEYGFFQIVNHGVPLDLMDQAIELSKAFFNSSDEVKRESSCDPDASRSAGYVRVPGYFKTPDNSHDIYESVLMFPPESPFNVIPSSPLRKTLDELFKYFVKTGQILEEIINDSLGFPTNFLKVYNDDRSWDFMLMLKYQPVTEKENTGLLGHADANLLTFVLQEDVKGLEVYKDGEWIPVIPSKGTLVVNLCDVIQVLSNKKYISATHRVLRPKERSRHSFAFFYNLHGDKWVEPLPVFTHEIGVKPKYKGFYYKDFVSLKVRDETHPPTRSKDITRIKHYEI